MQLLKKFAGHKHFTWTEESKKTFLVIKKMMVKRKCHVTQTFPKSFPCMKT